MELIVVIAIIVLLAGVVVPALAPARSQALDASARQFIADLENARSIAIAERTRTRVLLPIASADAFGSDLALKGYLIVSLDRTNSRWNFRGKWARLMQNIAFDPTAGVMKDRAAATMAAAGSDYTGPYLEFLSNGSSSLNPNDSPAEITIASGTVENSGGTAKFVPQNASLVRKITIQPLTGTAIIQ